MRVGVPRETKDNENRIGLTPEGAAKLVADGHAVVVEREAGAGCGFADADYESAGAEIVGAEEAWASDLVVKVKEPLEPEYRFLGEQILFTYLHLAGVDVSLTRALLDAGTTAIAYETVEDEQQRLPLLAPMSAVAGSMATLMGSYYLAKFNGGRGILIGEILGEPYGKVVVVGDGVVGRHAAKVAGAMGARNVVLFGRNPERAAELEQSIPRSRYVFSTPETLAPELPDTDLLIGAVLILGARAPRVVTAEMVRSMPEGSVIVDVSIDQGGCVETSRPTSHSDPVYVEHGVTHYCVTNMPGAFPRTSTFALTGATLPYVLRIANGGIAAVLDDPGFAKGINVRGGSIVCKPVAEALGLERFCSE
jgi:alanine dehydrogenase